MFTTDHSVNIDTPLPLQILCGDDGPINFIGEDILKVGIVDKDDKSITIKFMSSEILNQISDVLNNESTTRSYKYIKPSMELNTLQTRVPSNILKGINKGDRLQISSLYIGMVEKNDRSSGILFAVIPSVISQDLGEMYEENLAYTQTPNTKSKIRELLENKDSQIPKRKLEYEQEETITEEIDPRLLELIEQLIQAINRIADALERIEEKLEGSNKF
eukprot:TRINITY_DN13439_c0_g1_i1.p1 TRINITY_DN13439_c0_g1~~TRINITY_DN13439_c0_g1_i1.p1  ORF type:complete len:218 (-),score=41.16 TRINITY_DN13439_c0_g1_i1:577-1230(-)